MSPEYGRTSLWHPSPLLPSRDEFRNQTIKVRKLFKISLLKGRYVSQQGREMPYAAFSTDAGFPNELFVALAGRGNLLLFVHTYVTRKRAIDIQDSLLSLVVLSVSSLCTSLVMLFIIIVTWVFTSTPKCSNMVGGLGMKNSREKPSLLPHLYAPSWERKGQEEKLRFYSKVRNRNLHYW